MKRLAIVWFRNDLRLHDNEVGFILISIIEISYLIQLIDTYLGTYE